MYVLGFVGSPRRSANTSTLVRKALEGAEACGATTRLVHLNDLTFRGCQGCLACQSRGECILRDDLSPFYSEIQKADALVLGSPVYMWSPMTAQMKAFVDRLFPFLQVFGGYTSRLAPGKRIGVVVTHGQPDGERFRPHVEEMGKLLQFLGFSEYRTVIAPGLGNPQDVLDHPEYLECARKLGGWLATR